MKLTKILIDRFGVWHDLKLPLSADGVNVLYGPNEAGKSTLLRFIRGVLYGFDPLAIHDAQGRPLPHAWEGALCVEHRGQQFELRRSATAGTRGTLEITELDDGAPPLAVPVDDFLAGLVSATDETTFRNVYAIGLNELQQLATLKDDDVARRIYGLSLGPEGRRILDATQDLDAARQLVCSDDGAHGELSRLFDDAERLDDEIERLSNARSRYIELKRRRTSLLDNVAALKSRQAVMSSQLKGHLLLERVWKPWKQVQDCEAELARLPKIGSFPDEGLKKLDFFDAEIATAGRCREALLKEARGLIKQGNALGRSSSLSKHALAIQHLLDERDGLAELENAPVLKTTETAQTTGDWNALAQQLGPEWSGERLQKIDVSPAAHARLTSAARSYRKAMSRRSKVSRRNQRMSKLMHQQGLELEARHKRLTEGSIDDAIALTRKRMNDLHELSRLQFQEAELDSRLKNLKSQIQRAEDRPSVPPWLTGMLMTFGLAGVVSIAVGLFTGVTGNIFYGLLWALLGFTGVGIAWGFRQHAEFGVDGRVEDMRDEVEQLEKQLREMRESIVRIETAGQTVAPAEVARRAAAPRRNSPALDPAESLRQCTQHLTELDQLKAAQQRHQDRRKKLSSLRQTFQKVQRDATSARQSWLESLKELGLPETVKTREAFDTWQRIAALRERWIGISQRRETVVDRQKGEERFRRHVEAQGRRMGLWELDYSQPHKLLTQWEEQLHALGRNEGERRKLRRQVKSRRREAAGYRRRMDELEAQRTALLIQGGAASREEFERRANAIQSRMDLEEFLVLARGELDSAARHEKELAIVEEDLAAFNEAENAERMTALNLELEEIDRELAKAHESLGSVKQEMQSLAADRRLTSLRHERAQLQASLCRAAEKWFGIRLAEQTVEALRGEFEKTCQPATLTLASRHLGHLTRGRYRQIWTPLGLKRICVDDGHGQTFRVDQLSGGTREQLFLALRMAIVSELASRGVELPMVLDDVVVNFDQMRTEAAVDALLDFSERGQQVILFTCHLHLAQLFENRGIEPIWLPGHDYAIEERLAG